MIAGGSRREVRGIQAELGLQLRLVELMVPSNAPGMPARRKPAVVEHRDTRRALEGRALQRPSELDACERQRVPAGPAAKIKSSRFVGARIQVEPGLTLHRIVNGVVAENSGETKFDRKRDGGRHVRGSGIDRRQLPVRSGRPVLGTRSCRARDRACRSTRPDSQPGAPDSTDSPPNRDQFVSPFPATSSRAIASEIDRVSIEVVPNRPPHGIEARTWPISMSGSGPKPGGWAIASPPISSTGFGRNPIRSVSIVAGRPADSVDPACDDATRERSACADPQDGKGRHRDERDDGRNE